MTLAATQFAIELRRFYYVTPKNYLDFINNYKVQLAANGKRITMSTKRLEGGLQKLIEAAEAVDRMQVSKVECRLEEISGEEKMIGIEISANRTLTSPYKISLSSVLN